jgi:hypothetical protein
MNAELRQVAHGFAYRVRSFTGYDVKAFAQQAMSRVGPIEQPQVPEFLRPALIGSSILKELKKYTNSSFMVANLLILSY